MPAPSDSVVSFEYGGHRFSFRSVSADDHILGIMRRLSTFYERDVLERLREQVARRPGAALDAGGFIGTHAVFFARICGLRPVVSFEANPSTFEVLAENVSANGLAGDVLCRNEALGSAAGVAQLLPGPAGNLGATRVQGGASGGAVPMTTLDAATDALGLTSVALLKIDVEGAELDVLAGAARVIARHRPVLCIEVHTARSLRGVLARLRAGGYVVVDCLGYSPTYILVPAAAAGVRVNVVNALWACRAAIPGRFARARAALAQLARALALALA